MPSYYFRIRHPNQVDQRSHHRNLGNLTEALAAAHGTARTLIRSRKHRAPTDIRGSLDIEDEHRRPLARLMLAEVAQQIS